MASERIINEYDSTRIANAVDTLASNLADYSGTTVTPTDAMKAKLPSQTTAGRIADAVETLAENVTSAGHTIMDEAGTEYNARKNLQFVNATIVDDAENDTTIITVQGGGGIALPDVSGATATSHKTTVSLIWTDPSDVVIEEQTVAAWKGTLVVKKAGSAPEDRNDGTVLINSTTRNAYSSTPLTDNNVEYGITYYYRFFPYTTQNLYTDGSSVSAVPAREVISSIPTQKDSITYDGTEKDVSDESYWIGYDSDELTIGGDTTGTNADTYTVSFTPNADYQWSDGTRVAKETTWIIDKATSNMSVSSTDVSCTAAAPTVTVTVNNAVGAITATPVASSICSATVSGNTVTITGLANGSTIVNISDTGDANTNPVTKVVNVTVAFSQTFTITLNLNDSNPDTWCTRTEGTVTEVSSGGGENEIDELMGYYPCMLLNGVEGVKLNPNNYAKDVDGNDVDITSGNAGDVMVKFPSRGYMISKSGTTLTISITSDPNKSGYKYPTYKGTKVQAFYHSAYEGYTSGSKLRSLSGKTLTASQTIGTFRTQAQANGTGYEQRTFNELTYLQCCALIKYKGKNMQTALGRGFVDGNSAAATTGGTNTYGLNYGETTGKVQMKLFGIEDFWGNVFDFVDGIFSNANRQIQVADGNFNDTGSGYTTVGASFSSNISGYLKDVIGTNAGGFAPASQTYGSATTYFCDYAYVYDSRLAAFGGHWNDADDAGLFLLNVIRTASFAYANYGSRLVYFEV